MFKIEWDRKRLNNFDRKMKTILDELPNSVKNGVNDALEHTQEVALKNKRGSSDKKLIPIEIVDFNKNKVVGRVYTDKDLFSYAPFLEYGTGTKAELPHIGNTKTFIASGYQYWFLPVDKVDKTFAQERIISINGELFYIMFATQPYPFMRPTAFTTRKENVQLVNKRISKMFNEVLK